MRAAQLGNRDGQSKGCPWPNQWPAQWLPFVHGDTLTHDTLALRAAGLPPVLLDERELVETMAQFGGYGRAG